MRAKHGAASGGKVTREYAAWQAMLSRCCDSGSRYYHHYGGRGISVWPGWRQDFPAFLAGVGQRPTPAHSLDRIDNEGNYEPGNVRWATAMEQVRNRRSVKLYEHEGKKVTLGEVAQALGLSHERLYRRVRGGWTLAEAISTPAASALDTADLYGRWYQMCARCHDPNHLRYVDYGGRGITVCPRWRGSFETFVADVGVPPPGASSLDRIDNDGSYEPTNVRWVTPLVQNRNRRSTRLVELDGWRLTLAAWADLARASYVNVNRRFHTGWPLTQALGTPFDAGRSPSARRSWSPLEELRRLAREWSTAGDQLQIAARAVEFYRTLGLPARLFVAEEDVLDRLTRAVVLVDRDVVEKLSPIGQRTCSAFHPEMLEARHTGQLSVVDTFKNDSALERAVRCQLKWGDPITPLRLLRAVMAINRAPRNFSPALARWIVDQYGRDAGTVLDPCAGYGGRLLGTMASPRNVSYIGFDVEPAIIEANLTLAAHLGCARRVKMTWRAVEVDEGVWPEVDLIIVGPPYYDREEYGAVSQIWLQRYPNYEAWREGFLRVLIAKALKAAHVVVVNVAKVTTRGRACDLPADVTQLAKELGGRVDRVITWPRHAFGAPRGEEKLLVLGR